MTKTRLLLPLLTLAWASPLFAAGTPPAKANGKKPPQAERRPVVDEYQGTKVSDDYRWLESPDQPDVRAFSEGQNAFARSMLDKLPGVPELKKRLTEIISAIPPSHFGFVQRGGALFAMEFAPPKQQPFLVVFSNPDDPSTKRVLVDPNQINAKGTTAIDFFVPSLDAKKVAVSLSEGGSEDGTVHLFEVATAKEIGEAIPRVNGGTAGGSLAFNADGSGFYYTRYPRGKERAPEDMGFFQQIYFHKIGTSTEQDVYALGKDFPRIAEINLDTSEDGKYLAARVANGDGGEFAHYLLPLAKPTWTQLTKFSDQVVDFRFGIDDAIYFKSLQGAPKGKILRMPLATPSLDKAVVVVPESDGAIEEFAPTQKLLYVVDLLGGPNQIRVFDHQGKTAKPNLAILPISAVHGIERLSGDRVIYRNNSYIDPPAWWISDGGEAPKKTPFVRTSIVDYNDCEVLREMATSKDGTKIPVNIIRKKGLALDGSHPTLVYGYGGYGVSMTPNFNDLLRVWIDAGGVYAVANIRGGGEFGDAWHKAGHLAQKQNVFDDFYAATKLMIDLKVTRPEKLAIEGGSNGGLLMGAMITQHPDAFRAVVSHVGVYDMLRVETTPNGAFNVTEYGTVKDPELFKALYAYSPYHRVVDKTAYPSILMLTGANDPRVEPWHSLKMVARLQAASSSGKPILLRTTANSGHGIGSSLNERIAQQVDVDAFLFHELGMKYVSSAGAASKKNK